MNQKEINDLAIKSLEVKIRETTLDIVFRVYEGRKLATTEEILEAADKIRELQAKIKHLENNT